MTVTDFADLDALVESLPDGDLLKQHASLDGGVVTDATVHAHHLLCREMTKRGLDHGHRGDDYALVKVLVEEETFPVAKARTLADPDLAAAIDEVAKATGTDTVLLTTLLTVDGYEMVVKHPGHSPQSVHGRRGGGMASASIIERVKANGGLTVRANGQEPKTGYIVAVRGMNKEIPADEFFDPVKGPQHLADWAKQHRDQFKAEPGQPGRWMGLWHDEKNGEVVLDVVEQHRNRDTAIAAGRDRNQQAIWDVRNFAEIDTGGTGDRADKAAGPDGGAGLLDHDGRGDRRLEPSGVGVGGSADAGAVEKRTYKRDSHGRFAAVSSSDGHVRSSERHGSTYLDPQDHALLGSILPKRVARLEYADGYAAGKAARDQQGTEHVLGRRHDAMKTEMARLRGLGRGHGDVEAESLATTITNHMGFIDGALGIKRHHRMPVFGTTGYGAAMGAMGRIPEAFAKAVSDDWLDWAALPEVQKRQYVRDSHGRFAEVAGSGGVGLTGRSVRRPGEHGDGGKPDLIEIRDQFGDSIRLTKSDSLYHHLERKPDGSWGLTAERERLHDELVAEALAGVPGGKENPTMYMLGGGPAAGKTTMLNQGGLAVPTTGENGSKRMAVLVNADEVKMALPEFGQSPAAGRSWKEAAGFVHEESSLLSKRIQQAAIAKRCDIVLDGTGDSKPQKLASKIQEARDSGYRVEGHYATVPTGVAVNRSHNRGQHPVTDRYGNTVYRYVPPSIVMSTHAAVSDTFPKAQHLFDSVSLYDTTDGARRIAHRATGERGLTVDDSVAFKAFLAKGDE